MAQFSDSYEKIRRAERKFDKLKVAVNAFVKDKTDIRFERDGDTIRVLAVLCEPIDPDIAFEAWETVAQLRSALNKMMADICVANGRGTSGSDFPFGGLSNTGEPEPFPTTRQEGIKKKLTSAQWAKVLAWRPHPGGNDTLWAINTITNKDKHGQGLIAAHASSTGRRGLNEGNIISAEMRPALLTNEKMEDAMITALLVPGTQAKVHCEKSISIVFGPVAPVEGKNVLVTINQQIRLTRQIVRSFEDVP